MGGKAESGGGEGRARRGGVSVGSPYESHSRTIMVAPCRTITRSPRTRCSTELKPLVVDMTSHLPSAWMHMKYAHGYRPLVWLHMAG
jgi:hypothetical protein